MESTPHIVVMDDLTVAMQIIQQCIPSVRRWTLLNTVEACLSFIQHKNAQDLRNLGICGFYVDADFTGNHDDGIEGFRIVKALRLKFGDAFPIIGNSYHCELPEVDFNTRKETPRIAQSFRKVIQTSAVWSNYQRV